MTLKSKESTTDDNEIVRIRIVMMMIMVIIVSLCNEGDS